MNGNRNFVHSKAYVGLEVPQKEYVVCIEFAILSWWFLCLFFCVIFQTNYLSQIGGLSVGDNTRRVLSALFTSDLARQMTMHGSSQKYAFKETHLYGILLGKRSLI